MLSEAKRDLTKPVWEGSLAFLNRRDIIAKFVFLVNEPLSTAALNMANKGLVLNKILGEYHPNPEIYFSSCNSCNSYFSKC